MKTSILLTQSGLELPCVILPVERQLFPEGKEVLVYCQNRLAKGYIKQDDYELVAEVEIQVDFCIIPELDEVIKESKEEPKIEKNDVPNPWWAE